MLNDSSCTHIFFSTGINEYRFIKESTSILRNTKTSKIYLLGTNNPDATLDKEENINEGITIKRIDIWSRRLPRKLMTQIIKYAEWVIKVILTFSTIKSEVVVAHSISALPVAVTIKLIFKCKVIYDAHEHETETTGLSGLRQKLTKISERFFIRYVDSVFVVSESIRKDYQEWYKCTPIVLMNLPEKKPAIQEEDVSERYNLKKIFNIPKEDNLFIYLGYLFEGRGIELTLNAFEQLQDTPNHVVFIGDGELKNLVLEKEKKVSNIHYHEFVPPHLILHYTKSADVGLSLIEAVCLSYKYCLPNKAFEYINSGLPIIVSDELVDLTQMVNLNKLGVSINKNTLAQTIRNLNIDELKDRMKPSQGKFYWENYEYKFIDEYKKLLKKSNL